MKKADKHIKIVGRRSGQIASSPEEANALLHTVRQLRGDRGICPRGVYRFESFEEAHAWMIKMLAQSSRAGQLLEGRRTDVLKTSPVDPSTFSPLLSRFWRNLRQLFL